jgi:RNA polymerase sigma factor (sigma-70 family)
MPDGRETDTSLTMLERLQRDPDDPEAWRLFLEKYQPRIRRWCVTWGLQDSDADDVTQEVLVKLFAALRKFQYDPSRSFRAWLKTVAQHAWSDFVSARRRHPGQRLSGADTLAESAEAHSDLEKQLEDGFNHELFGMAMNCVKNRVQPDTWKAFHLTAIEGLSGAEAAAKLQIPVGSVFVAKHRVQKMLQEEVRLLKNEPDQN